MRIGISTSVSQRGQSGIGQKAHQPDPAAPVNQPDPGRRQAITQLTGCFPVYPVDCAGRAAKDA